MDRGTIYNLILLIVLILVQVLICNHIHIFNVAVPFIFIYVIIRLPMTLSTSSLLTWAFFGGLIVDIFSDTPGVNSLACTLLAGVKRPVLYAYIPRDDRTRDILPSLANLGFGDYSKYMFSLCFIYCFLVFNIEYLSIYNVKNVAIMTGASSILTFFLLLAIDSLMVSKKD